MRNDKKSLLVIAGIGIVFLSFFAVKFFIGKDTSLNRKGFQFAHNKNIHVGEEVNEGDYIVLPLQDDIGLLSYGYEFTLLNKEQIKKMNAEDRSFQFALSKGKEKMGNLEVVIREIDNGDKFIFTQFKRTTDEASTIPLQFVFDNYKNYSFLNFEEEIEQEHDRVFGIDYTSNVKGIYTIEGKYDLLLSQNYISTELREVYDGGKESVLRELVNEDKNLKVEQKKNRLRFELELRTTENKQFSEHWALLSSDRLFSSEQAAIEYKNQTNHDFISSRKWLTATGPYTKLPWSIEPSTKLGYGRNLVVLQGTPFVKAYEQQVQRFYYDMIVNSVNYLLDFKEDATLWETEYTSTWLKNDYGIIAPYTDTRHNENIALFLSKAGEILQNEQLKNSYLLYAQFLVEQEQIDNILRTDNGYYILDYYSEVQTEKTHVSLNHALGEMSYLFDAYEATGDEAYLAVALNIKAAVEDTGSKWINQENGDLWYQINGDGSFEGKDYDTLTLIDLATGIQYYEALQIPYDDVHRQLMTSKIDYLMAHDVPLLMAEYELLLSLGFDQLAHYPHVISFKEDE